MPPTKSPTMQPTMPPTKSPTVKPTAQPTIQPSQPTSQPTRQPSRLPTTQPTTEPSNPSSQPTMQPTQPTGQPSSMPTFRIISTTLKEGLIAFYTFDGDANDNSGNANHGTIHKGVTFVPDRFKQPKSAVAFNGSAGGYIEIVRQQFNLQNVTISFWMKTNRAQSSRILDHSCLHIADPTTVPTETPSEIPSQLPSVVPTTTVPSQTPSNMPSVIPTRMPSMAPSGVPTTFVSPMPTVEPTEEPSESPTEEPTVIVTTRIPSQAPSRVPSVQSSQGLTPLPTEEPSESPSSRRRKLKITTESSERSCVGGFFVSLSKDGMTANQLAMNYFPKYSNDLSFVSVNQTLLIDNAWTHIVMVKASNIITYYVNGGKSLSQSFPSAEIEYSEILPLIIGAQNGGYSTPASNLTNFFTGVIDDLFIYNRVLPPSDIFDLLTFDAPTSQPTTQPSRRPSGQPSTQPTVRVDSTLKKDLIAFYPFDGNPNDNTNNNNHGINVGAKLVTDRYGFRNSAYSFDGVSSYIYFKGKQFNFAQIITISFWVKPCSIQNAWSTIMDKRSISSNVSTSGWFVGQNNLSMNSYVFDFVNQTQQLDSPQEENINLIPGIWSHVVIIKSTIEITYYVNGERVYTKPCSARIAQDMSLNAALLVGATNTDSSMVPTQLSGFFNGSLDDLFFYNRTLTEDEVMRLYFFDVPTSQPSSQPTRQPSSQPSRQPSSQPSMQPSRQPTSQPTKQPTSRPSGQPTRQPSSQPTKQPFSSPTAQPTQQPSSRPSGQPSSQPTRQPINRPSGQPSQLPTGQPTRQPSRQPSSRPTSPPTCQPTLQPSLQPSSQPSYSPTTRPSTSPSSVLPTSVPSSQPSSQPSRRPSGFPSAYPSVQPSNWPTCRPSIQPSSFPTSQPTSIPSCRPSTQPTIIPSSIPSAPPSEFPSGDPSSCPTSIPTTLPSSIPTRNPSRQPTTRPSVQPSEFPSAEPSSFSSVQPSSFPTKFPSNQPTTQPAANPTSLPTSVPSRLPTSQPSDSPTTRPSVLPSINPSSHPSEVPSPFQLRSLPFSRPLPLPRRTTLLRFSRLSFQHMVLLLFLVVNRLLFLQPFLLIDQQLFLLVFLLHSLLLLPPGSLPFLRPCNRVVVLLLVPVDNQLELSLLLRQLSPVQSLPPPAPLVILLPSQRSIPVVNPVCPLPLNRRNSRSLSPRHNQPDNRFPDPLPNPLLAPVLPCPLEHHSFPFVRPLKRM
jgi:hypothetical protein